LSRRGRGIRWHLFQVLLVSIVPIGLLAAALLYLHWKAQESERERSQIQLVRLLAAAVDNALDSTVERLSILAKLWGASSVRDEEFYAHTREALQSNDDWTDVLAFRADGRRVFRADTPSGAPPPTQLEIWRAVVTERKPVVSDLIAGAGPPGGIAVGVPVVRGGKVSHVLVAALDLRWYDGLLTGQGLPDGGVAGLFDRSLKFVARSSEGAERRGGNPSEQLVADMKARREGIGRYTNLAGTSVYTAWTFTRHGWGVGIATPAAPIEGPLWRHLVLFGFLWLAAMGLAILYAFSKARLITASLESLEGQARHVAAGRRIADLPASRVIEIDRAVASLEDASVLLQSATQQRVRSLDTEREARTAAEEASRAKDEFLAMLGHELRNPLSAISNAAAILRVGNRTGEHLEFVSGVIARQTQQLARLIDDLLDVGRAVTGKIALESAPLDLAASARNVATTLQDSGRLADRRLQLDLAPAWIHGDHTRVEQIVTNLLVNAATYTEPGGQVRVEVFGEAREAVLRITDDGRGIAPESLPYLFELFFQADATVDRATGGLGIGLTLVQRLARLHGGDVKAESEGPGRGASFTVRFPAISPPEPVLRPRASGPVVEGKTVLIVEDNDDARESLRLALELQGHRVLEATDGPGALDCLQREPVPVAVLDIGLPGLDGYELARRIRAALGPQIVLVALTGYGRQSDARKAMEAGFDQHLTKPVDLQRLAQAMEMADDPSRVGASR
jgi:signal transduction histidine kinase/ActR/RegA family two-component response regulator